MVTGSCTAGGLGSTVQYVTLLALSPPPPLKKKVAAHFPKKALCVCVTESVSLLRGRVRVAELHEYTEP